jgi:hypothetical protein
MIKTTAFFDQKIIKKKGYLSSRLPAVFIVSMLCPQKETASSKLGGRKSDVEKQRER